MVGKLDSPGPIDCGLDARAEVFVEQGAHGPRERCIPDRMYPSGEAARKEARGKGARFPQVKAEGSREMNGRDVFLGEAGLRKKNRYPGPYGRLGELDLADVGIHEPDSRFRVEQDPRLRADGRKRAVVPDKARLEGAGSEIEEP